ncbi:Fic family protein [Phyllobacterium zundukense]|uniref:Cell filamentation protein Fic n=1 Tax=Phyllobacterium zundukense TaxID=1867719 RepID=A0A2N9VXY0_9HYPH|nr:Fic family protein [Phyllobacterium zundukense]ATU95649.1 cell filamentation protein Fic [Phyllobacterium zundukense]PIO44348.1 cell filamentation protein Fic [Phyllobacterium zundukense]
MRWNWQQADWPDFTYDTAAMEPLERRFLLRAGEFIGAFRHVSLDDREMLKIELISDEALKTSEIEGEILDRDSLQSSLRGQFGMDTDTKRVSPAERGIAEMMVDLYQSFAAPLTHQTLSAWHKMVMAGQRGIQIGTYREHADPMQVVSGTLGNPKIHFEAPPSEQVPHEMNAFIGWFNDTAPGAMRTLPALTRAGIVHLYFESIHPFEDGNGRIGRALAEKSLAQNLGQPSLIALAYTIERGRRAYYEMLERSNKDNEVTDWLIYFGETILEAQRNTLRRVEFYIAKARIYDQLRGQLNPRQDKVIARLFREGIDGFKGGLSAENYISITKASRATTTRDLQDLVAKGALDRTGELRHTRYHLKISENTNPG